MMQINVKAVGASIVLGLITVLNACGGAPMQTPIAFSCLVTGTVANGVVSNVNVNVRGGTGPYSVMFAGQNISESATSFSLPGTYPVGTSSSMSIADQSDGVIANCSVN